MRGWPVWLASVSRWHYDRGRHAEPVLTGQWRRMQLRDSIRELRSMVDGVGDPARERVFRMNVTLCLHRALTETECAALAPARACHLAGGPIEVLWESEPGALSTQPCRTPQRVPLPGSGTWLPGDCGECDTCQARRGAVDELPIMGGAR